MVVPLRIRRALRNNRWTLRRAKTSVASCDLDARHTIARGDLEAYNRLYDVRLDLGCYERLKPCPAAAPDAAPPRVTRSVS